MHHITLDSETDFDGWRKAARTLALNDVKPADVTWRVRGNEPELFAPTRSPARSRRTARSTCPQNSSNWRRSRSCIATVSALPCSIACCSGCSAITTCSTSRPIRTWPGRRQWSRRCVATSTRCTPLSASAKSAASRRRSFVAWFEPEHHIVELAAPFFARRFADMPWSILTPDLCAHWDGHAVSFTPGVAKIGGADRGPAGGDLAALLRQHLQSGPAEGEGDADGNAEEILAEPARGFDD